MTLTRMTGAQFVGDPSPGASDYTVRDITGTELQCRVLITVHRNGEKIYDVSYREDADGLILAGRSTDEISDN